MAIQYAIKEWDAVAGVKFSDSQLKAIHAALCDAVCVARDRQLEWLNVHENPMVTAEQSADAWQQFKEWEARETACCEALGIVRATGVELSQTEFGWS